MKCPKCHRSNVVKHGRRNNRAGLAQKYLCRRCGAHFTIGGKRQIPKEAMRAAIAKVASGWSLRKTATWLQREMGVTRSHETIFKWVKHNRLAYKRFRKNQAEILAKYAERKRTKEEQRLKRLEEQRQRGIVDGLSLKGHRRAPPNVTCPTCGSTQAIRCGLNYSQTEVVQSYRCKKCFRTWASSETRFPKYKTSIEVVLYADTRYFMHPTLRQVQKEIENIFHLTVSRTSIMRWIRHEKEHRAQLSHRNQVFPGLRATIDRLKNEAAIQEDMNRP